MARGESAINAGLSMALVGTAVVGSLFVSLSSTMLATVLPAPEEGEAGITFNSFTPDIMPVALAEGQLITNDDDKPRRVDNRI
jgi:hypothetical protein